jgi:plasmid stabilization system protein ParE
LIGYTRRALRQVEQLIQHYAERERYEAIHAFRAALDEAERKISSSSAGGLPAPRPYPQLARSGWAWVKAGRYWIAYRQRPRLLIAAVFFETANIPTRL